MSCKTSLTLNNYILHFCHVSWGFSCMTKSVLLPSIFILFLCCTLDLNQKYGKNALFLKKYLQNICKFRTNPLPLHSLSLPNECASRSSLKDWHRRGEQQRRAHYNICCRLWRYKLKKKFLQCRVWSWLRMNASYRLNTCKSRGSMVGGLPPTDGDRRTGE